VGVTPGAVHELSSGAGPGDVSAGPARAALGHWQAVVLIAFGAACGASAFLNGFFELSEWGPAMLVVLAALLALLVSGVRPRLRWEATAALVGLSALAGWSFLSIGWSESAGQALNAANQWALYAAAFALLLLILRSERAGQLLIGAATAGILVVAVYVLIAMRWGDGPGLFVAGRLNDPLGYVNGEAALFLFGFWPLIAVAERARRAPFAGLAAAGAALLGALVVLSQSRGAAMSAVASIVVLLAVVPGRQRRFWLLAVVLGSVGLLSGPLVDVYNSSASGEVAPKAGTVESAAGWCLLIALLAGVVWGVANGLISAAVNRREELGPRLRTASAIAIAAIAVGCAGVAIAWAGRISDRVSWEKDMFVNLSGEGSGSRLLSGGGNRSDFWRIALDEFKDHPVVGVGAGNYDRFYYARRHQLQSVAQPHSIEFQTLAELGIVGGLLLLAFLVGVFAGLWRRARAAARHPSGLLLTVAGGGIFVSWLGGTSVDWLQVVPGVTGVALCAAAVLVIRPPAEDPKAAVEERRTNPWAILAGAVVIALLAVWVTRLTLADKYLSDGQEVVATQPAKALADANRSLDYNRESLRAYYLKSAAYARLGQYGPARAALVEATKREPHDFVPWALLGDLALRRGDLATARKDYARAAALNPRDPILRKNAKDPRTAERR
jgi:hypothetical protein